MRDIGIVSPQHPWAGAIVGYDDETRIWYVNGNPIDNQTAAQLYPYIQMTVSQLPAKKPTSWVFFSIKVIIAVVLGLLTLGAFVNFLLHTGDKTDFNQEDAKSYLQQKYPDLEIASLSSKRHAGSHTEWYFTENSNSEVEYLLKSVKGKYQDNYVTPQQRRQLWKEMKDVIALDRYPHAVVRAPLGISGIDSGITAQQWIEEGNGIFIYIPESEYEPEFFAEDMAHVVNLQHDSQLQATPPAGTKKFAEVNVQAVVIPDKYLTEEITERYKPSDFLSVAKNACYLQDVSIQGSETIPLKENYFTPKIMVNYTGVETAAGEGEYQGITLYYYHSTYVLLKEKPYVAYRGSERYLFNKKQFPEHYDQLWNDKGVYVKPFGTGDSPQFYFSYCATLDRTKMPSDAMLYYFDTRTGVNHGQLKTLLNDGVNYLAPFNVSLPNILFVGKEGLGKATLE